MPSTDILLPNGRNWDLVPIATIQYIESDKKLCKVVTPTREYIISRSLQSLMPILTEPQFLRIHKRYIVAIGFVNAIGKAELQIAGRALPVSRVVIPELYRRFPKFG